MGDFIFFKKKAQKRFIAVCPTKLEKCFLPRCCGGCMELKSKSQFENGLSDKLSF